MILLMGGKIKTAEYISGRYADMLSNIYMAYACLWYYEKNKHIKDLDIILDGCMNEHFINIQNALHELSNNIPLPLVGKIIRYSTYPFGKDYYTHNDVLTTKISNLITKNTEVRDLLTENVYISNDLDDRLNQIMRGLPLCSKADYIKKISDNKVISYEDNLIIKEAEKLKNEIIKVDKFSKLVNTH